MAFYLFCGVTFAILLDVALFGTKGIVPIIKDIMSKK